MLPEEGLLTVVIVSGVGSTTAMPMVKGPLVTCSVAVALGVRSRDQRRESTDKGWALE